MNFVKHPSATTELYPAAGDEKTVGTLPIAMSRNDAGDTMATSFWKPDPAERKALANGHLVMLHVFGTRYPPVMLQVEASAPTAARLSMEERLADALERLLLAKPTHQLPGAPVASAAEHNAMLEGHRVIREYRASVGR